MTRDSWRCSITDARMEELSTCPCMLQAARAETRVQRGCVDVRCEARERLCLFVLLYCCRVVPEVCE